MQVPQQDSLNSLMLYYNVSQCQIQVNYNMELEIVCDIL